MDIQVNEILEVLIYSGIGVMVFAIAFFVMVKLSPFSVQKEIEEDQNTALGIVMGSVIIGLALIIASVVSGTTVILESQLPAAQPTESSSTE